MNKKKSNYSFFDFLSDITDIIFNLKDESESPFNINFTNHYTKLYDLENDIKQSDEKFEIDKILQNNKDKSITVNLKKPFDKEYSGTLSEKFDNENIKYNSVKGKISSFTITKNSKGVLEERKFKEQCK